MQCLFVAEDFCLQAKRATGISGSYHLHCKGYSGPHGIVSMQGQY